MRPLSAVKILKHFDASQIPQFGFTIYNNNNNKPSREALERSISAIEEQWLQSVQQVAQGSAQASARSTIDAKLKDVSKEKKQATAQKDRENAMKRVSTRLEKRLTNMGTNS